MEAGMSAKRWEVRTSRSVDWKVTIPREIVKTMGLDEVPYVLLTPRRAGYRRLEVEVTPAHLGGEDDGTYVPIVRRPATSETRKIQVPTAVMRFLSFGDTESVLMEWRRNRYGTLLLRFVEESDPL
jgi:hypothetical protein